MNEIAQALAEGRFFDTRHAEERQTQRGIIRPEIIYVLCNGYHEKIKDKFDKIYSAWNYAIRGKTIDKKELRIIVSFDENNLLIITAIDLGK